jgi:hypothetical protein
MAVWIALAFAVVGLVAGVVYAVLRGLSMWRQIKRTGGSLGTETARISEASERIQVHLDRASASQARLADAANRLAISRARLDVQLAAVREARQAMRRMLWFLPG